MSSNNSNISGGGSSSSSPQLISLESIEATPDAIKTLQNSFIEVKQLVVAIEDSETAMNDVLLKHSQVSQSSCNCVQLGLLYSCLTEPAFAPKAFKFLILTTKDNLSLAVTEVSRILGEFWPKLVDIPRQQMLWLFNELVKSNTVNSDHVLHHLLRRMSGGDISHLNLWLTESVLNILCQHRSTWLEKKTNIIPLVVYCYLRLLADHSHVKLEPLRKKETEFVVSLLREHFAECMGIGRDLIRLLQDVAKIPEIEKLWQDMLYNPALLSPKFQGIGQVLSQPTGTVYITSRLTHEMEQRIRWFMKYVHWGSHKRYLDWFTRKYFNTPESQSLRVDWIRYVCTQVHPSNEVLASETIQRWCFLSWHFNTCTNPVVTSNMKLALYYDWLMFDRDNHNIMNVEPGVLVIYNNLSRQPLISTMMLDFLCRICDNYFPSLCADFRKGVKISFTTALEKKMFPTLNHLFDSSKLDAGLKSLLKQSFPELLPASQPKSSDPLAGLMVQPTPIYDSALLNPQSLVSSPSSENLAGIASQPPAASVSDRDRGVSLSAEFSDAEMSDSGCAESVAYTTQDLRREFVQLRLRYLYQVDRVDIEPYLDQLDQAVREKLMQLRVENRDNEIQCDMMYSVVQHIIEEEDTDLDFSRKIATCLCEICYAQFQENIFPKVVTQANLDDSVYAPIFVIFRTLCQYNEDDPKRQPLYLVLSEMAARQPRLGYFLLYFLKVDHTQPQDDKFVTYKEFCKSQENPDLKNCLFKDLSLLAEDDIRLFVYLLPDVFQNFPSHTQSNPALIRLIVGSIDGEQLQTLVCDIMQRQLNLFKTDSLVSLLNESLSWEALEQYFLWQLLNAQDIPTEKFLPILPRLNFQKHAEAMTNFLLMLKLEQPSTDLVRAVLSREPSLTDGFSPSILGFWAERNLDKLAIILQSFISQATGQQTSATRTFKQSKGQLPSLEQILRHIDIMRQKLRNLSLLQNDSIQDALRDVVKTASNEVKYNFPDLLALADDFEDDFAGGSGGQRSRSLRAVPSRKAAAAAARSSNQGHGGTKRSSHNRSANNDTSSSSSGDDEPSSRQQQRPKKRMRTTAPSSNSSADSGLSNPDIFTTY